MADSVHVCHVPPMFFFFILQTALTTETSAFLKQIMTCQVIKFRVLFVHVFFSLFLMGLNTKRTIICSYRSAFFSLNVDLVFNGFVVQSIVSVTSSFRGQLVKCFTTL